MTDGLVTSTSMTKPNNNDVATEIPTVCVCVCIWEKIKAERKSKRYKRIFILLIIRLPIASLVVTFFSITSFRESHTSTYFKQQTFVTTTYKLTINVVSFYNNIQMNDEAIKYYLFDYQQEEK